MSSLAQEESRSISENVTWGQRKRMIDGKVSLPYKHFLGYEKGDDSLPKIVEDEAAIVRRIYALFLEGKTPGYIAKHLTNKSIPTPTGLDKWHDSTIRSILTNEKYMGAALLQKKFTVDFLTKKTKVNEGEVPQYYVENSHPAIISPETFELVQSEIRRRKETGYQGGAHPFSGKIICGNCGSAFGSKVWQSTNQYRRVIWQCNAKYPRGQRGARCHASHVTERDIKEAFIKAFNQLLCDKDRYIAEFEEMLPLIADTAKLEQEEAALTEERDVVSELIRRCVEDNARTAQNQESYNRKYTELATRFETVQKRLDIIAAEKRERVARKKRVLRFLDSLRETDELITEFDEAVWSATVDKVTVLSNTEMKVTFKDGSDIYVEILR